MASFSDVVTQVRTYAPFFATVSGAATYELAESQLNGAMPACVIVPARYTATPQVNMTAVWREVIEVYDLLVAIDNTSDRAGAAATNVAFDNAFAAVRGAMDGWTPQNVDGSSDYLFGFAFSEAEPTIINGAKSYYSFKFQATRVYGVTGSLLSNPLYLANLNIVSAASPPMSETVAVLDAFGNVIATAQCDLGP
jgi:hypothetical protein